VIGKLDIWSSLKTVNIGFIKEKNNEKFEEEGVEEEGLCDSCSNVRKVEKFRDLIFLFQQMNDQVKY
jgi:hypothetical protein